MAILCHGTEPYLGIIWKPILLAQQKTTGYIPLNQQGQRNLEIWLNRLKRHLSFENLEGRNSLLSGLRCEILYDKIVYLIFDAGLRGEGKVTERSTSKSNQILVIVCGPFHHRDSKQAGGQSTQLNDFQIWSDSSYCSIL